MKGSVLSLVPKNGYYWDEANKCYWNTGFTNSDVVRYKGGGGHYGDLSDVRRGNEYTIEGISLGNSVDNIRDGLDSAGHSTYAVVFTQRLHLKGVPRQYTAKHFTLVRKGIPIVPTLQIEVDRPCLVFELDTDADTGKTSVKDIKKAKPFDSMSKAKAWVEEQIVTSIRENNVYPKYSVYEERFVGRAEKPPVVFE